MRVPPAAGRARLVREGFSLGGRVGPGQRASGGHSPTPRQPLSCRRDGLCLRVEGAAAKTVNKQMPVASLHGFPFIYLYVHFAVSPDSGDGAVMLWWPPARDPAPVLHTLISLLVQGLYITPSQTKREEKSNLITCH